ncbi:MAG: dihydrolipoyllysine-residue acetyltransferase [Proteobacteria bacterium]|nr:dihydrolipoyllysine-residue acetyltransferase [Pseudomonadota bacterium]
MGQMHEAKVPDIGNFHDVPVIELLVAVGDTVKADQGLVTLESDKATMEVPSPLAGVVKELKVKLGDRISEGGVVAVIEAAEAKTADASHPPLGNGARRAAEGKSQAGSSTGSTSATPPSQPARSTGVADGRSESQAAVPPARDAPPPASGGRSENPSSTPSPPSTPPVAFDAATVAPGKVAHASPAVRVFARELGVDLGKLRGSERGGRITKADVQAFVKNALQAAPAASAAPGSGLNLIPWPKVDFSKFGAIESRPLSRIQKLSGANLARNWAMIPHVTQHDEADITAMEAFRKQLGATHKDVKVTPLVFLIKAAVAALRKYPAFNSSLDGDNLILKQYFHIGIAVDTPNGLVVPVIRDADRKGLLALSHELAAISAKARDGKLAPADMSGGCFSISSLGGIGGTAFTPIINAPEVAILGVSKSQMRPQWNGEGFEPRLLLPLSLSYDHRVIDGAAAARFTAYMAQVLGDLRLLLL